jgi:hypothetical protein
MLWLYDNKIVNSYMWSGWLEVQPSDMNLLLLERTRGYYEWDVGIVEADIRWWISGMVFVDVELIFWC